MRTALLLTVLLTLTCFFLDAEGTCHYKGSRLAEGDHVIGCSRYTCHLDGHVSAIGCPAFACEEQIGYIEEDMGKPYPDCCERPICKEAE